MFLPFEQEGVVFNGAENTTVSVQVTIPAGWSSPACGAASTLAPIGYRQMGTIVSGWTCDIENLGTHQVLHWTGPQVSRSQTNADSAQFFTFAVRVPSPATTTSYGAIGGPEGFYVKQVYADGATSLWRTPNSTLEGEVANGIVRTVSNAAAPPPKSTGSPPPPEQDHGGPPLPGVTPPAVKPNAATPKAAAPNGSSPQPAGGGSAVPAPAGDPLPAGSPTEASPTSASTPASTDPSPEADPAPSSAVEQATQKQAADATDQGVGWHFGVGIMLAAVLVAGGVLAVLKRRRRPS
jgi:hypothetical protein